MGAIKEYMMNLAEALNKNFDDLTTDELEAQNICADPNSNIKLINKYKKFLPTKTHREVSYYDAEDEMPKFQVGDIIGTNYISYLIIKNSEE